MNAIVSTVIALLAQLLPAVSGNSALIGNIVNALIQIIPALVQEYQDLLPMVKNVIAVLQADPATTQDQLGQLTALDAQVDAAFDAAAAAAEAADAPPAPSA